MTDFIIKCLVLLVWFQKFSASASEQDVIDEIFPDVEGSAVDLPKHYNSPRKYKKPGNPVKIKVKEEINKTAKVILI